jgi:hypothetical protein
MSESYELVQRLKRGDARTASKSKMLMQTDLSPSKKRAVLLLKAQEVQAQKSRLETLLSQQYIGKFGSKNPKSKLNDIICKAVKDYVRENDSIQPETLATLENKLASITSEVKSEILTERRQAADAKREREAREAAIEEAARSRSASSPFPPVRGATGGVDTKQWSILNAAMMVSDEEKERIKRAALKEQQVKFKLDLDRQKSEVDRRKQAAKSSDYIYAEINKK